MRLPGWQRRVDVLVLVVAIVSACVAKAWMATQPVPETPPIRAMRLIQVGMTYDEVKTALGEDGSRDGAKDGMIFYTWSWMDGSVDVTFDADQRVTFAAIYKRKKPDAPFWDVLTHMGY